MACTPTRERKKAGLSEATVEKSRTPKPLGLGLVLGAVLPGLGCCFIAPCGPPPPPPPAPLPADARSPRKHEHEKESDMQARASRTSSTTLSRTPCDVTASITVTLLRNPEQSLSMPAPSVAFIVVALE